MANIELQSDLYLIKDAPMGLLCVQYRRLHIGQSAVGKNTFFIVWILDFTINVLRFNANLIGNFMQVVSGCHIDPDICFSMIYTACPGKLVNNVLLYSPDYRCMQFASEYPIYLLLWKLRFFGIAELFIKYNCHIDFYHLHENPFNIMVTPAVSL